MPAREVTIDTNLLLLMVIGLANPGQIDTHKRVQAYSQEAFNLLIEKISNYNDLVLSPNTLTETSNLLDLKGASHQAKIVEIFRQLTKHKREVYIESRSASEISEFPRLGLADSCLLELGKQGIALISSDYKLYLAAQQAGYESYNFAHIIENELDL